MRRINQNFLWAVEEGDVLKVRELLNPDIQGELVADVNAKGLDQWTALHFAANEGKIEVLKELLSKKGIRKDAVSSIQRTPLHLAVIRGNLDIARALI
jgi:ankyrin repeat protein